MNTHTLVKACLKGNEQAQKQLYDAFASQMMGVCYRFTKSAEDAEDVSQEVFIQVYESIKSFKGDSKFSTWIYRIAVTKSLDLLRRKKRKKRFAFIQSLFGKNDELINDPPDFYHPGVAAENKENAAVLFKAIAALPENQHTSFVLSKIEGLSYQEVSEVMQMTEASVVSLLHRAKTNLRKTLGDHYRNSKI